MEKALISVALLALAGSIATAQPAKHELLHHQNSDWQDHHSHLHHKKHHRHQKQRPRIKRAPITGVEPHEPGPVGLPTQPNPLGSNTPSLPPGPETPLATGTGQIDHTPSMPKTSGPSHRMPGVDGNPSPAGPTRP